MTYANGQFGIKFGLLVHLKVLKFEKEFRLLMQSNALVSNCTTKRYPVHSCQFINCFIPTDDLVIDDQRTTVYLTATDENFETKSKICCLSLY